MRHFKQIAQLLKSTPYLQHSYDLPPLKTAKKAKIVKLIPTLFFITMENH